MFFGRVTKHDKWNGRCVWYCFLFVNRNGLCVIRRCEIENVNRHAHKQRSQHPHLCAAPERKRIFDQNGAWTTLDGGAGPEIGNFHLTSASRRWPKRTCINWCCGCGFWLKTTISLFPAHVHSPESSKMVRSGCRPVSNSRYQDRNSDDNQSPNWNALEKWQEMNFRHHFLLWERATKRQMSRTFSNYFTWTNRMQNSNTSTSIGVRQSRSWTHGEPSCN